MINPKVQRVYDEVCVALTDLSDLFVPGMKLTFIARMPGNDEADVLIGDDQLPDLAALIARQAERPPTFEGKS